MSVSVARRRTFVSTVTSVDQVLFTTMSTNADIANNRYALFTSFRKDGRGVGTAVWIAPFGDGEACFTTGGVSGKVKRLAHTSRVTLQACDVRGRLTPGSQVVEATARVVTGADCGLVNVAMSKKYKIQFRMLAASNKITSIFRKSTVADTGIIISFH